MPDKSITERVAERMAEQAPPRVFTPEVVEAMRLADLYESVKPEEYILPIDALAGFPAHKTSRED
jgi:hypothetical protein